MLSVCITLKWLIKDGLLDSENLDVNKTEHKHYPNELEATTAASWTVVSITVGKVAADQNVKAAAVQQAEAASAQQVRKQQRYPT